MSVRQMDGKTRLSGPLAAGRVGRNRVEREAGRNERVRSRSAVAIFDWRQ